ncbi:MAG: alanine--tRNA ligase, partial [Chloroflexi bacterium]|nr:alanine--tRNA ligase [Chloroflexota bacterium]
EGKVTAETLDTDRFVELWNLVFIQYNRTGPDSLTPLPATHVDTGLGFDRIVQVLQKVNSNYRTDLLWPLIEKTAQLSGHSTAQVDANFTPYRVIADHARAATFLIADGVVPGNMGRNYVTRMIIRRAYRFGGKIGLHEPFMAAVAETVIEHYGEAYPELVRNKTAILATITREEEQFQRTLDKATGHLETLLDSIESRGQRILPGHQAADLYTTYGMPFEITRDIAQERGLGVDEDGFTEAMDIHRLASGAGKAMGPMGGEDVDIYRHLLDDLQTRGKLGPGGVTYDPYNPREVEGEVLALILGSQSAASASPGDRVEILLPETRFYIESGGQVSDTGTISALSPEIGEAVGGWQIRVTGVRKPAAGVIVHVGEVMRGRPQVGDTVIARVDAHRRKDITRNHTATHLLHAALHEVLGDHARQAGSLVAPDRLRFDFTHPEAVTNRQIEQIEQYVNEKILEDYVLRITSKSLQAALDEGAMALFGEKYGETVRNITMGEADKLFSNELCGGTHCERTGDIGIFIITSEGSVAAGIRRIEAVTGREAYKLIQRRFRVLNQAAATLMTTPDQLLDKAQAALADIKSMRNQIAHLRQNLAAADFTRVLDNTSQIGGADVLTAILKDADADSLRQMADRFRQRHPENGVAVLASVVDERPIIIAVVTQDLVKRGLKAGDLVKFVAKPLGGGGGGRPTLAQAGGQDASKLDAALASVAGWVTEKLSG